MGHLSPVALFLIVFAIGVLNSNGQDYMPHFLKTKYGGSLGASGVKTSYTKTKTKTNYGSSPYIGASFSYGSQGSNTPLGGNAYVGGLIPFPSYSPLGGTPPRPGYAGSYTKTHHTGGGGCGAQPMPVITNAGVVCSKFGTSCKAECIPDYQFPTGETEIFLSCNNGMWEAPIIQDGNLPSCQPICLPECQNNGICIAPHQCNCPENFSGPQCQFENKPCLNAPPKPVNARRVCKDGTCTVTCMPGHEYPDGSEIASVICKDGIWLPEKTKWTTLPPCKPVCKPKCQNGGVCLAFNVCQCPSAYRGPQCQYSVDVCSVKTLQFNGASNCSGDAESFSCQISCPPGIQFEFAPEHLYTCYYSTGQYQPSPIPQCLYPENAILTSSHGSSHNYYVTGQSGFNLNSISVNGIPHEPDTDLHSKKTRPELNFNDSNVEFVPIGHYGQKEMISVEQRLPKPGTCFTWGGTHFKTFDGKVFSFNSKCSHVLARDSVDNTFSIVIQNNKECYLNPSTCHRIIKIYLQNKQYFLKLSELGTPIFASVKKTLPIPSQLPGLRVQMAAHYVVVSLDIIGAKIKWDGKQMVQLEVKENLWNRTEGLCGKIDGYSKNDLSTKDGQIPKSLITVASSWKVDDLEDDCNDVPTEEHACEAAGTVANKAKDFCERLLADKRFASCHKSVDISPLLDACKWDYCSCEKYDPSQCACETLNVYVRDCAHKGIKGLASWRDEQTCPMECTGGKIYKSCGPSGGQPVCGSTTVMQDEDGSCVEGCYCPEGTVLHENKCITKDKCPCQLRGKNFVAGTSVPKDCNSCTCIEGQWVCTQVSCGARCSAVGDPHYITFDGKKYDFMGQCSYYLVKTNNFTIEAENVACAGSISEAMNFPVSISSGLPSCTKTVTIKINGQIIKLKQNHDVVVNGEDVSKLPYQIAGVTIRSISSIFLQVHLPNGVQVWWDGVTRAYIDVPPTLKDQTKGLCGTFNNNQKDDFLTPEDDIEQAVTPFANKWKTSEMCNDVPEELSNHPCDKNIHNKGTAEKYCAKIKSALFKDCHWYVDPEQAYQNCLYDMCACEFKVSKCLCPTLSDYAQDCARHGVKIYWRDQVRECGIHCPGGQKYQICGNSCTRTCSDISTRPDCQQQCVEGCNCPEGEALDENGECIPIGECKCQFDGIEFRPGYKEVRPASKGQELCTCLNANWLCKLATPEEIKNYPKSSDLKSKCNSSANFEFTSCEEVEPVTCKNMHSREHFSPSVCHAGCKCKDGYVLDSKNKVCVKPTECPCHHGGKSYKENSIVQSDCNTCKCQNGKWKCTDRQCSAECSAWGDSHYKTFDGKHYDYQGQCDYVLAKGALDNGDAFDVTIQNVPCGSLGTTCSKSVTIRVSSGTDQESVTLTKDKPLPRFSSLKHVTVRVKGLFVIVEAPDLGMAVHWDMGTRVYVKADPRWKDKIKGLCGNYNDNDADDFQTPSGGITEVSANIFGDSWRLQPYCPEALEVTNTCEDRPDRKIWALKECGILKSPVFAPCHSEVPLDIYFEKCVFDSCACDQGGDCECLCTALAAYTQECNNRGVPIKWRTQHLCPMQCDERCSKYSPCISTCSHETCDNLLVQSKLSKSCGETSCIEGCSPKPCPPDQVYLNSSYTECVPRNICKPVCMEVDGVTYYEGDLMEEDDCHSCYCSREQKICKGQPCPVTQGPFFITHQLEQLVQCKDGWTKWINQDKIPSKTKTNKKKSDVEPLPTSTLLNNLKQSAKCDIDQMVEIECRTVKTHIPFKKTGADVECSLERGLVCKGGAKGKWCPDFEIRVKCRCEQPTTAIPYVPCDTDKPHQEHPTDCHLFYHCSPGLNGPELVEKSCGEDMLYNPVSMICDFPYNVVEIKPECETVKSTKKPEEIVLEAIVTPPPFTCPSGMVYDECAIKCDQLCMFYSNVIMEEGMCQNGAKCEAGCVSAIKEMECPNGMFWANNETCVSVFDCMCRANDGSPVKPGKVIHEKNCKRCQCIDNFYSCHISKNCLGDGVDINEYTVEITKDHNIVDQATPPPIIIPTSVTPPPECEEVRFINLIQGDMPLPDEAFNASSVLSPTFAPSNGRLNNGITDTSGGSWAPKYSNEDQYLQIDLGRQEPVYGVIVQGSPLYDEYVTSYSVLYSPDGHTFYYVLNDEKRPESFRGSIDATTPVKQIFSTPVEAKVVRINPQTWNNGISLRVELIGCGELISTTPEPIEYITIRPTSPPMCVDTMGLEDGTMSDQQITVSSELSPEHSKKHIRLNDESSWQPLTNSPTEWIEFDFLEPRNITGVVTQGGKTGWVTTYTLKYAHDDKEWNPILDEKGNEKVFLANVDKETTHTNNFDMPICAKHLRLIPSKWQHNIEMRLEIQGCYQPYPTVEEPLTTPVPSECNYCPGVNTPEMELNGCRCTAEDWWDGENCVTRTQCPCIVGHIPYAVGSVFEEEDCSQCICKLGGVKYCTPKKCPDCPEGLKRTVTTTCGCTCKPCPENTVLCPSSNICINETLWCNGVRDCSDDELDCPTPTPEVITILPTTRKPTPKPKPIKQCPKVTCPPGYDTRLKRKNRVSQLYLSPMISIQSSRGPVKTKGSYYKGQKGGGVKGGYQRNNLGRPQNLTQGINEQPICKEYKCVSKKELPKFIHSKDECPPVVCQENYIPIFDFEEKVGSKDCPRYSCYPPPEPDAVCNVTGRTFNTFDDTEFKYDICNHVLARDLENDEWDISLKKNCEKICSRDLVVRHQNNVVVIHPDLSVEYDGFKYSVDQTKKIGSQNEAFSISRLGNTLLFVSNRYGFWIIWNSQANVKLGVVHKLVGKVDGLCGYFSDDADDDKRKPDGTPARTTVEFGDSWALSKEQPAICEAKACPIHVQNKAWEICNKVKEQTLSPCSRVVDLEAFVSRCLEITCACLESASSNYTAEEQCRCESMQSFVVDCLTADPTIDISDWRMQQDCPATCDSPLVYHDCYQRKCEPTCESLKDPNLCPKVPNVCFPGCYCPAGFVRKGDTCITPSTCRDCECNVLPHLQYVTYDENNFTVNGNCVYVMSRDVLRDEQITHGFQVLVTNAPCRDKQDKMCVGKVTILYKGHKIHILLDSFRHKLKLIVDSERIDDFSEVADWMNVRETATKHYKLLLIDTQVEVSVYFPSLGVSVKAPSHKYSGKLEGLCGDCNGDPEDDIKTSSGTLTEDTNDFALSWLYENLPGGQSKEMCENKPQEECPPLPADSDPCLQLVDVNKFGQCLRILDPTIFIEWCKKDACGGKPERSCTAIEAYARDCASAGFCINWRNDYCPAKDCAADQTYDPCGTSCPKSCDTIKGIEKNCKSIPTEGCYCPEGKVFLNDTCVYEKDCEVCDEEGHHPGDVWKKDKCTTCRCEGTSLKCDTQHCTGLGTICELGFDPIKIPSNEDECCDKYACVPEATAGPTCETPQTLSCGPGQIMKLDAKPNGCQQFICECKPIEDCDPIDLSTDVPLEPGYVKEIDESGCCPVVKQVCKTDLCPEPKDCPQYHSLKDTTIEGKCCPLYSCEPPKDKCIYETEYTADQKGGERLLTRYEKRNLLKRANETWKDGPCRECKCLLTNIGNYQPTCTKTNCPVIETFSDYADYELEHQPVFEQCCPNVKRVACKYHGKVYTVGEKWPKGNDYCTTIECVETEKGVEKETRVQGCEKECELGSEYVPATPESKECCGSCKQVACVMDGVEHKVGAEWKSKDHCMTYQCVNVNGSMQVQSEKESCPVLPEDYTANFVVETIPIPGQCCAKHLATACKVGSQVYQINETWPSPDGDKCKNITCREKQNGELVHEASVEGCKKDCAQGSEYQESNSTCCGSCVQIACVVDGELKEPGENWTSPDGCTTYSCEQLSGQFVVIKQQDTCPDISECPEENIYLKGCCKFCNATMSQTICSPEPIKAEKTIGLIKATRFPNGLCVNKQPVKGFTECIGSCHSSTFFNIKSGLHESLCTCCQATKYEPLQIELECEDGFIWKKKVAVPSKCGCEGCSSRSKNLKQPGVKGG